MRPLVPEDSLPKAKSGDAQGQVFLASLGATYLLLPLAQ